MLALIGNFRYQITHERRPSEKQKQEKKENSNSFGHSNDAKKANSCRLMIRKQISTLKVHLTDCLGKQPAKNDVCVVSSLRFVQNCGNSDKSDR